METKTLRNKLSDVDFSEHELIIKDIYEEHGLLIHHLKVPGTVIYSVKFINTNGVLVVTGDLGNWVFCREFHPSADGYVSPSYWTQKLRINSEQSSSEYSSEATEERIREDLDGGLEEYGYKGERLEQMKEYLERCLSVVDSEFEYQTEAYMNMPDFMDAEDVIFEKEIHGQLKVIFDAFNEICNRLENEASK